MQLEAVRPFFFLNTNNKKKKKRTFTSRALVLGLKQILQIKKNKYLPIQPFFFFFVLSNLSIQLM